MKTLEVGLLSRILQLTELLKIRDTVTGGSVLASGAQPPASVANFFRWVQVEPCDSICFDIQPIFIIKNHAMVFVIL
jgi:hypothetical protein